MTGALSKGQYIPRMRESLLLQVWPCRGFELPFLVAQPFGFLNGLSSTKQDPHLFLRHVFERSVETFFS